MSFVYFVFFVFSFAFVCRLFTNEQTNEKRVFSFADVCPKGGPLPKKNTKIFSQPSITIHTPIESPSRVDMKYFVLKIVYFDFWPKEDKKQRMFYMTF